MIVRSRYDPATEVIYSFFDHLIPEILKGDHYVVEIFEEDVTRKQLEELIILENPDIFLGMGHGLYGEFTGQNKEIILDTDNAYLLEGKVVYLLSCQTGEILGEEIAKHALAYVGYDEDWLFEINRACSFGGFCSDNFKRFLDIERHIIFNLLELVKTYPSRSKLQEFYDSTINKMDIQTNGASSNVREIIKHNRDHFVVIANRDLK